MSDWNERWQGPIFPMEALIALKYLRERLIISLSLKFQVERSRSMPAPGFPSYIYLLNIALCEGRLLCFSLSVSSTITQSTQRDISQSEVLHLEHVQPIHHHHSLDQVSFQINMPT